MKKTVLTIILNLGTLLIIAQAPEGKAKVGDT
ncbi:MAG: hypothetical protein K0S26_3092, partial [Bacteroidota bacterium]|nr:hypothetical protein [Bacteroidota bacterium]